jgi:hypothetical protein
MIQKRMLEEIALSFLRILPVFKDTRASLELNLLYVLLNQAEHSHHLLQDLVHYSARKAYQVADQIGSRTSEKKTRVISHTIIFDSGVTHLELSFSDEDYCDGTSACPLEHHKHSTGLELPLEF